MIIQTPFRADPDENMVDLLQRMDIKNVSQAPVVENGNLLGVITRKNLLEFIHLRGDLGAATAG